MSSLKITMPANGNTEDSILYENPKFEFNTGVTVLIGRNGAGKSTLLDGIKTHCNNKKIPCFHYDNYKDGGDKAKSMYGAMSMAKCIKAINASQILLVLRFNGAQKI